MGDTAAITQGADRLDEWVLGILQERRAVTLDELLQALPPGCFAPLLLAIDRLARSGHVQLCRHRFSDYLLALGEPREAVTSEAAGSRPTPSSAP